MWEVIYTTENSKEITAIPNKQKTKKKAKELMEYLERYSRFCSKQVVYNIRKVSK